MVSIYMTRRIRETVRSWSCDCTLGAGSCDEGGPVHTLCDPGAPHLTFTTLNHPVLSAARRVAEMKVSCVSSTIDGPRTLPRLSESTAGTYTEPRHKGNPGQEKS